MRPGNKNATEPAHRAESSGLNSNGAAVSPQSAQDMRPGKENVTEPARCAVSPGLNSDVAAVPPRLRINRYHRYYGYDYSRGAVMFVSTSTEPRQSVFSRIEGGKAIPTDFGRAVLHELFITTQRVPEVKLSRYVLMPDHVHLLLWITPGQPDGLKRLGRFVGGFKRAVRQRWKELGHQGELWQEGYHDLICLDRDFIEGVKLYIDYNPLKWELMHTEKGLIPIREPLDCAWLPDGTYWKGIGRCDLLDGSRKLCAVRISRRLEATLIPQAIARLKSALEKGYCFVSTFLSPGERALYRMLSETGAEFVHIKGTAIPVVYRPSIHETPLFAAKRLLVLGRQTDEREVRRPDCLALNDAIAKMAVASGGTAVYVKEGGHFDFARRRAAPPSESKPGDKI